MQNMWRLVLLAFLWLPESNAQEVEIKVMTWNLKWFPGGAPTSSVDEQSKQISEVAEVLAAIAPDVLIVQEVQAQQPLEEAIKAANLPLSVHTFSKFKSDHGLIAGQQIAICSRFPAQTAWFASWENGWAHAPRGYSFASIDVEGQLVLVYGLHLKSNLGPSPQENTAKREDAVEQLMIHADQQRTLMKTDLVIIAGDFNTAFEGNVLPSEKTLSSLLNADFFWPFEGIPLERRITIPGKGRYPDACFDHIFLRNFGRPIAEVYHTAKGSDHLPVVVKVKIPKGSQNLPK